MKANLAKSGDRKTIKQIEAAANEVCKRCDEITTHAADTRNMLSECFTLARAVGFNETCEQFLVAIAKSESNDDIIATRKTLEHMREHVMQANQKITIRLGDNRDPTMRIIAKFAAEHLTFVRIVLTAALTNVRKQLERIEHNGEVKVRTFSFKALQQLLSAIRGRPADRAEALDFMRSLYATGDAEFNTCHKVINYVRTCKNAHEPYFNQCARIRTLVKTCAKKNRGDEERIWRSFAQELKPSHAKCRKPK